MVNNKKKKMSGSPLNVLTNPEDNFVFTAPPVALYNFTDKSTTTTTTYKADADNYTPVVSKLALTLMWDSDGKTVPSFIESIFTFELKSALLDSAPSGKSDANQDVPNLFLMSVLLPTEVTTQQTYIVDAQIQTKGNSAMSPTYITDTQLYTKTTNGTAGGKYQAIVFPVTNFFNVSAPGAPYTVTLTLQLQK